MIRWNGVAPLPREGEQRILIDLCLLYLAAINPCQADELPNIEITESGLEAVKKLSK